MHFMPMRAKIGKTWMVGMWFALPYFPFPNMLTGVDGIQNCSFVTFFAHQEHIHQVSLDDIWR